MTTDTATQTRPANPVARSTLARKAAAKATESTPAAPAPKPEPRRFPVVRPVPSGALFDPAAKITRIVPNPKLPSAKNWKFFQALVDGHAAGQTIGEIIAKHRDLAIAAEVRHGWSRGFLDLSIEPTKPAKPAK